MPRKPSNLQIDKRIDPERRSLQRDNISNDIQVLLYSVCSEEVTLYHEKNVPGEEEPLIRS